MKWLENIKRALARRKAWNMIAPIQFDEPRVKLDDRLRIQCIHSWLESEYSKDVDPDEMEDIEFREGFKVYGLNRIVIIALEKKGYMIMEKERRPGKVSTFTVM